MKSKATKAIEGMSDDEKLMYMLMYAPGETNEFNEAIPGRTWLQKEMFLLGTAVPGMNLEFTSHRFGAYCDDLDQMRSDGIESGMIMQPGNEGPLQLTDDGADVGKILWNEGGDPIKTMICDAKKFMNDMSSDELVAYSYSTFPETAENSEILERFKRGRVGAACTLFQKEKVTLGKAVLVSGLSYDDFVHVLEKKGIPAYTFSLEDFRASMKEIERFT